MNPDLKTCVPLPLGKCTRVNMVPNFLYKVAFSLGIDKFPVIRPTEYFYPDIFTDFHFPHAYQILYPAFSGYPVSGIEPVNSSILVDAYCRNVKAKISVNLSRFFLLIF